MPSQRRTPHGGVDEQPYRIQHEKKTILIGMSKYTPRFFLCVIFLAMFCTRVHAVSLDEYAVKAGFVHNIAKFVQWHASGNQKRILRLCVLGQGPFAEAAGVLQGKAVGQAVWAVAQVARGANLTECQVLFIEASEAGDLRRLLDSLKDSPVLTMGDTPGFGEQGVMVNFYLEKNKVRFEINLEAANSLDLKISSQVLKLARIVHPAGGEQ